MKEIAPTVDFTAIRECKEKEIIAELLKYEKRQVTAPTQPFKFDIVFFF
jgi:hypothetical protein